MSWDRDIRALIREVGFSLQRFLEDEDVEELQAAISMLVGLEEDLCKSLPQADPVDVN